MKPFFLTLTLLLTLNTTAFAQDFFTTETPTVTFGTDTATVTATFDKGKHSPTSNIPLSAFVSVTGRVSTKGGTDTLIPLSLKTVEESGVYTDTFSLRTLNPSTQYDIVLTAKGGGVTAPLPAISFTTPKTAEVADTKKVQTVNDPDRYDLLAPFPGILSAILDPTVCVNKNPADLKPGEICDLNQFINLALTFLIGICAVVLVVRIIIAGYAYMTSDVPFVQMGAKNTIKDAAIGLLVALSAYLILNTINPRLVTNTIILPEAKFDVETFSRADDPAFISGLDRFDTTGISVDINNLSNLHVGYLAHQQGVAGASAIIWAAKNNYSTVPENNPFTKANINRNMAANFPKESARKTIKTDELTPKTFLKYWLIKLEAVKRSSSINIPPSINADLAKVSQETGVPLLDLQTMCRIEALASCSSVAGVSHTNKYGFTGLFQLGKSVWAAYGKKEGDIKNAYHNAYAAAKYYIANVSQLRKNISR